MPWARRLAVVASILSGAGWALYYEHGVLCVADVVIFPRLVKY